ncbi:hypothetical protein N9S81_00325 [bacterium]|nr:hypothetical protein [bacterium]
MKTGEDRQRLKKREEAWRAFEGHKNENIPSGSIDAQIEEVANRLYCVVFVSIASLMFVGYYFES